MAEKKDTYTAFIDFRKAFDCVNRDLLFYKIWEIGIDGKLYFALKSLYTATEASVRIGNDLQTNWFPCKYGVRQGDSVSLTLFSIYINDLMKEISSLNLGIKLGENIISHSYVPMILY